MNHGFKKVLSVSWKYRNVYKKIIQHYTTDPYTTRYANPSIPHINVQAVHG